MVSREGSPPKTREGTSPEKGSPSERMNHPENVVAQREGYQPER